MRGRRIVVGLAIGALMGVLAITGCKKGKRSSTAAGTKSEPAMPSGTMETSATMKTATLEDTYWALLELSGKSVDVEVRDRTPFLELNAKKQSAYGFGGCNRFFGSYESSGESLTFGALGATRMACPEGMDREQELFTVLGTVTRYEIDGSTLLLFADDTPVARFEARPRPAE